MEEGRRLGEDVEAAMHVLVELAKRRVGRF